jgi:MYXO-CTERM domain-containing protein
MPATVEVGDVDEDGEKTVGFDLELGAEYPCGAGLIVQATLDADNAASVSQEIFLFPGYKTLFSESFGSDDNGFFTNVDEKDAASGRREGALVYTPKVELTCDMSQRSPERDASLDNDGAFITGPGTDHVPNLLDNDPGEGAELDGDTSLWSPTFELAGTRDPEIRFAYWLDGGEGDALLVQLSADGEETFVTAKEITDSFHGWVIGRVSIRDAFGNVPEKVSARFVFDSQSGTLEGGIDEVRVLDFDGQCLSIARGSFCGCSESGDATPTAPVAMLLGLAGLRGLRRRRRG